MPRRKSTRPPELHPAHFPIPKPVEFATPLTVTNATSSGTYTGPRWQIRSGGEDHKRFKSLSAWGHRA